MAISTIGQEGLSSGAQYTGFKNRIINGDMRIDQRTNGSGLSISQALAGFGVDRFSSSVSGATVGTLQRSSVAPAGFTNSLSFTVTTPDTSMTGTDVVTIWQRIEGYNVADFGWGTSNASTITLSFWVRSSVTGSYGVRFSNSGYDRTYVAMYSISASNTWEYKTITLPGDTTGTWNTTNGNGVVVEFCISTGTTYHSSTSGSWQSGNFVSTSAQTNLVSTNGATFYMTGVQLEKGSVATSFDYRPYGTELQLCQRYCVAFDNRPIGTSYYKFGVATWTSSTSAMVNVTFPVTMRSAPTSLTTSSVSNMFWMEPGVINFTNAVLDQVGEKSGTFLLTGGSGGPSAGYGGRALSAGSSLTYVIFNAEM